MSLEEMERKVLKEYSIYNIRRLKTQPEDEIKGEIEGELPTTEK